MATTLPEPGPANVEDHAALSHWFLEHAHRELANGTRTQASEKVWGAVAHALKAVGEKRGWFHSHHQNVKDIGGHLASEFERPDFLTIVNEAENMHNNFYSNEVEEDEIQQALSNAELLVADLDELRETPPRPFTIQNRTGQRRLGRLLEIEPKDFQNELPIGSHSPVGFSRHPEGSS